MTFEYENTRRVEYEGGALFIPICTKCGRYVKAAETVQTNDYGLKDEPNADCKKCGPTKMIFEGFI